MDRLGALSSSILRLGQRALTGERAQLSFTRCEDFRPPRLSQAGIYVHVPYCRSLCPYCPYLRFPYRPAGANEFTAALLREIDWYAGQMPATRTGSVYFGGGTPTLLGQRLGLIVEAIRDRFDPHGPWCIETNPADLDASRVALLKALCFDSVSLGVQSFDDRTLRQLGRGHGADDARRALACLADAGIPSLNVDLMFAVPGQAESSWQQDIELAIASPATQVTAYPLFTFPYSEVGERRRLDGIRMPPWRARRRMYYELHDRLVAAGFRRVSVWSFQRGEGHRFSSVTRRRYLGLGPSGASVHPQHVLAAGLCRVRGPARARGGPADAVVGAARPAHGPVLARLRHAARCPPLGGVRGKPSPAPLPAGRGAAAGLVRGG